MKAKITAFLVEHPRSTAGEIADGLSVPGKTIGSILASMRRNGVLSRGDDGRWAMAGLNAVPVEDDRDLDMILDALGLDRQLGLSEALDAIAGLRSAPTLPVVSTTPAAPAAPAWPVLPAGWEYVAMRKSEVDDNDLCVVTPMVTLRSRP